MGYPDSTNTANTANTANTVTRTFSDKIDTGTAVNGDQVVVHTGSWKETSSRSYGTPDQVMGPWGRFNLLEQMGRDMGASERQVLMLGIVGMMGNPKTVLTNGLPSIVKAVNSNLPHAVERAVERGIFANAEAAANGLRAMAEQLSKNGFPANAIPDTAHADRVLVPIGEAGMAVYQVGKNGTAKLKTVLNEIIKP